MKESSYYLYEFNERFFGSTYRLHLYLFKKSKDINKIKELFEHYKHRQIQSDTSKLFIVKASSSHEAKNTILSYLTPSLPKFSGEIVDVK